MCFLCIFVAKSNYTMTAELRDLLAIHLVPGIGPKLLAALLERFGSFQRCRRKARECAQETGTIRVDSNVAQERPGRR